MRQDQVFSSNTVAAVQAAAAAAAAAVASTANATPNATNNNNHKIGTASTTATSHSTASSCQNTHRVFVYGTLKSKEPNAHIIAQAVEKGHARYLCRAQTIERYPLLIASRYNIPFLLHHPGEGKNVYGEIYEVSDETLTMLDDFEGHPEVYLRMPTKTSMLFDSDNDDYDFSKDDEDVIVECWTYFLHDFEPSLLLRQHEFLDNYSNYDPSHGLCYVTSEDIDEDYDELSALKAG